MRRRDLAKEFNVDYKVIREIIEANFPGEDWKLSARNVEENLANLYRDKIKQAIEKQKPVTKPKAIIGKDEKLKEKILKKKKPAKAKKEKEKEKEEGKKTKKAASKTTSKTKTKKTKASEAKKAPAKKAPKKPTKEDKAAALKKKEEQKAAKALVIAEKAKKEEEKAAKTKKEKEESEKEERKRKILQRQQREKDKKERDKKERLKKQEMRKKKDLEDKRTAEKKVNATTDAELIEAKGDKRRPSQKKKYTKKKDDAAAAVTASKRRAKRLISKDFDIDIETELYELEHKNKKSDSPDTTVVSAPKAPAKKPKPKLRKKKGDIKIDRRIRIHERSTTLEIANFLDMDALELIKKMKEFELWLSPTQQLSFEEIDLISQVLEIENINIIRLADEELTKVEEDIEDGFKRAPVITVMGHIDHGKTTLLDALRNTNVAAKESGGITQHIGASYVENEHGEFCMIDTPGHSAFTAMRARGAKVCDIVILVVAADDGVKPQTVEAINHARTAGLPIIVVVNKIDKNNAKTEVVKTQLSSEYNLLDINYGGKTQFVEVSALKKTNIEAVIDAIQLQSIELNLNADPGKPATGFVLEAQVKKGMGSVATVIITNGTLNPKDNFVCGTTYGRVKTLFGSGKKALDNLGPSHPGQISGFAELPEPGDVVIVVADEKEAKELAQSKKRLMDETKLASNKKVDIDYLFAQVSGDLKELKVIVKTDVVGSEGVLNDLMQHFQHKDVKINLIHSAVGDITDNDVFLAASSDAMIFGFKVKIPNALKKTIDKEKVRINMFSTIFEIEDFLKELIEGNIVKETEEKIKGHAEIRAIFTIGKVNKIAGCYMKDGVATRNSFVRVLRKDGLLHEGNIESLKREKNDAKEVKQGLEFGLKIKDFNDIEVGDVLEFYIYE
ncbi:translation initiation factor IF-2 [bacterium]|nr:translation initiation factor IF-2 [bacterium]